MLSSEKHRTKLSNERSKVVEKKWIEMLDEANEKIIGK